MMDIEEYREMKQSPSASRIAALAQGLGGEGGGNTASQSGRVLYSSSSRGGGGGDDPSNNNTTNVNHAISHNNTDAKVSDDDGDGHRRDFNNMSIDNAKEG